MKGLGVSLLPGYMHTLGSVLCQEEKDVSGASTFHPEGVTEALRLGSDDGTQENLGVERGSWSLLVSDHCVCSLLTVALGHVLWLVATPQVFVGLVAPSVL